MAKVEKLYDVYVLIDPETANEESAMTPERAKRP